MGGARLLWSNPKRAFTAFWYRERRCNTRFNWIIIHYNKSFMGVSNYTARMERIDVFNPVSYNLYILLLQIRFIDLF